MIYELREYTAAPARSEHLHRRFAEHVLGLLTRHGLDPLGYWTDASDDGRIVYLLRFADEAAQSAAWKAFQADPDWHDVKAESEKDGPVVAQMTSRNLVEPPYWQTRTMTREPHEEQSS